MPAGGYQPPANPAPVSGPGALSQRTDGGPAQGARWVSDGSYGDGKEMMNLQKGAPLAGAAKQSAPDVQVTSDVADAAPLGLATQPSQFPDEHVTTGNGTFPSTQDASTAPAGSDDVAITARALYAANPTPWMRYLLDQIQGQGR